MAVPPRKDRRSAGQRQAMEMLAASPHGVTEDLLALAHGFDSDVIAGLVPAGLATAERETIKAGGEPVEVSRIKITEAGASARNWRHADQTAADLEHLSRRWQGQMDRQRQGGKRRRRN